MIWRRVCGWLEGLADPYAPAADPPVPQVWPVLRAALWPLRRVLVLSILATIASAAIEVWLISTAGQLIDTLSVTPPSDLWSEMGGTLLLILGVLLLVVRPLIHFAREGTNDLALKPNAATLIRWRSLAHVARQPVGWFQNDFTGRTAHRTVEIGSYGAGAIYSAMNAVAYVGVYQVGIVLLFSSVDPWLMVPLALWLVLYATAFMVLFPRFMAANERFQAGRSALSGRLVDAFGNISTLRTYANRAEVESDFKTGVEDVRSRFFALQRVEVSINVVTTLLEGLIIAGLVGTAIALWANGQATVGTIAAALALVFKITSMVEWFLDAVAGVLEAVSAMKEALETVGQPLAIKDAPGAKPLMLARPTLCLENVAHHYGRGSGVVEDISLTVAPGEKLGLVGPSGAGKSTLIKLILRQFEAEQGRISVDGQAIDMVTQDSLHAVFGLVEQDASLLHRSVAENIAIGRPDAPQAKIIAAARTAGAHDFIQTLQDSEGREGYAAHVGERGVKLSGGQRQRIAIARALLKDAPILILDEATSALDSETEALVQKALVPAMEGKTVIAIAHRLSTIQRMDRIVVMDRGRIVESGPHSDLLAQNGLYARLWSRQSGGFLAQEAAE